MKRWQRTLSTDGPCRASGICSLDPCRQVGDAEVEHFARGAVRLELQARPLGKSPTRGTQGLICILGLSPGKLSHHKLGLKVPVWLHTAYVQVESSHALSQAFSTSGSAAYDWGPSRMGQCPSTCLMPVRRGSGTCWSSFNSATRLHPAGLTKHQHENKSGAPRQSVRIPTQSSPELCPLPVRQAVLVLLPADSLDLRARLTRRCKSQPFATRRCSASTSLSCSPGLSS